MACPILLSRFRAHRAFCSWSSYQPPIRTILEQPAVRELTANECRNLRAVEVLERVGNAEARQMLTVLSRGDSDAQLTRVGRRSRQLS